MKAFRFIASALTAAVLFTGCEFITVIPPESEVSSQPAASPVEAELAPAEEVEAPVNDGEKPAAVPEEEAVPENGENGGDAGYEENTPEAPAEEAPPENVENVPENSPENPENSENQPLDTYVEYHFRSKKLLTQHFEKHGAEFGEEFGYNSAEDYEKGASDVINDPAALTKTEAEDGDGVYYIVDTNEFVILSTDGYIRTYFRPSAGIDYYNRQ